MTYDVRAKVRDRLTVVISTLAGMAENDRRLGVEPSRQGIGPGYSESVRNYYRGKFFKEFPGCEVTFQPGHVWVKLPDGYPGPRINVGAALPTQLTKALYYGAR